jgi:hypothetical protein
VGDEGEEEFEGEFGEVGEGVGGGAGYGEVMGGLEWVVVCEGSTKALMVKEEGCSG